MIIKELATVNADSANKNSEYQLPKALLSDTGRTVPLFHLTIFAAFSMMIPSFFSEVTRCLVKANACSPSPWMQIVSALIGTSTPA